MRMLIIAALLIPYKTNHRRLYMYIDYYVFMILLLCLCKSTDKTIWPWDGEKCVRCFLCYKTSGKKLISLESVKRVKNQILCK